MTIFKTRRVISLFILVTLCLFTLSNSIILGSPQPESENGQKTFANNCIKKEIISDKSGANLYCNMYDNIANHKLLGKYKIPIIEFLKIANFNNVHNIQQVHSPNTTHESALLPSSCQNYILAMKAPFDEARPIYRVLQTICSTSTISSNQNQIYQISAEFDDFLTFNKYPNGVYVLQNNKKSPLYTEGMPSLNIPPYYHTLTASTAVMRR
ncbi:hypothetical protein ACWATR_38060 [Nostoc sp. UIC 10890]